MKKNNDRPALLCRTVGVCTRVNLYSPGGFWATKPKEALQRTRASQWIKTFKSLLYGAPEAGESSITHMCKTSPYVLLIHILLWNDCPKLNFTTTPSPQLYQHLEGSIPTHRLYCLMFSDLIVRITPTGKAQPRLL